MLVGVELALLRQKTGTTNNGRFGFNDAARVASFSVTDTAFEEKRGHDRKHERGAVVTGAATQMAGGVGLVGNSVNCSVGSGRFVPLGSKDPIGGIGCSEIDGGGNCIRIKSNEGSVVLNGRNAGKAG